MSEIKVSKLTNRAGTGAPDFSQGVKISGTASTLLAPTRTESATEPTSPSNGDTWYDTENDYYDVYINDEWKRFIGESVSAVWYGDRAVTLRGQDLEYFDITTSGNAANFGDTSSLLSVRPQGMAGDSRGVFCGSSGTAGEDIQYITTSTTGNATAFGDLTIANSRINGGCASNGTRGLVYGTQYSNVIEYITIATTGDATDFGDCLYSTAFTNAYGDATRAIKASAENINSIEYVTFDTAGNGTDFGDMIRSKAAVMCGGDTTRMLMGGGWQGSSYYNDIDYITIQTTGNAADFGNLTNSRASSDATQNATRTVFMGGTTSGFASNIIDYVTTQTTGNASDLGDLVIGASVAACSGAAS